MKCFVISIFTLLILLGTVSWAHCEIPCGIYGDEMRFAMIVEHIDTIEKSMTMINELAGENPVNYNQLVRWINNKELHANEIQDIVSQYFLTQRIKPIDPEDKTAAAKSRQLLESCHNLLVFAMQAKQGTDLEIITKLRATLDRFRGEYFEPHQESHQH